MIAVTGCDGAGKSRLSEDLLKQLDPGGTVQWLYLGQSSGNIARWIADLPVVGPPMGRFLVSKANRAHNKKTNSADTATTLVIFIL